MNKYKQIRETAEELIHTVESRDKELMAVKADELEHQYRHDFDDALNNYDAIYTYFFIHYAAVLFFHHNNFLNAIHSTWEEVNNRYDGFSKSRLYSSREKEEIHTILMKIKSIEDGTKKSFNVPSPRMDCRCSLCRKIPANALGSHMAPNFLTHPSLSFDQKGKRYREATDRFAVNDILNPKSFYGAEVPPERIKLTLGHEMTDEDRENNINWLEYDNYFCAQCERRFAVLETAYAEYYHNPQKSIHSRVSYLFWLSVLWRMGISRMSLYLDAEDEFSLREILDKGILADTKSISADTSDLGEWCYAIYRVDGIKQYDKGVLGSRQEHSPYVLLINDLIVVLFHAQPSEGEVNCGPLQINTTLLNTWKKTETILTADRRCFMDMRDWLVETSYHYYDPPREQALLVIREGERSTGRIFTSDEKNMLINARRLVSGPVPKIISLRKVYRFQLAALKKRAAEDKGETYNFLQDEDLYLTEQDFLNYYMDLLKLAKEGYDISRFPFYEEARTAFPNAKLSGQTSDDIDAKYESALNWISEIAGPKGMADLFGVQEINAPIVHYKIRPNDLCPCGSGLKYKKCCGRRG